MRLFMFGGRVTCFFFLCILILCPRVWSQEGDFVIGDVRVQGLQRISEGTVFNYLPFKVGDRFNEANTGQAIRSLYQTGFFEDVRLERDGDTLVVIVKERPGIGSIEITGNKEIKTEDLLEGLEQIGFAEGRVFDRSQLDRIEQELTRQYFALGRYAARIGSDVQPLENNRVAILLEIEEGDKARIRRINIVGNRDFKEKDLLDEFESKSTRALSFLLGGDQYSRQTLSADLERLRSFYLDRGYIRFSIDSTQVTISPDRRQIYVTINVTEGGQYRVSDISLAGDFVIPQEELFDLIDVRRGDLFERKAVTASANRITQRLGEEGYALANVNPAPEIDDEANTVEVAFLVDPGKRTYVRRISFSGNERTRDEVLRREMRQQESSWFSTRKVDRGRVRLERLGYFSGVEVQTPQVAGSDDQVDVKYSVQENPAGNLLLGIGFSQNQGLILRTSITQDNFLGSGNRINFTFNNSEVSRAFALGYLNPYYTIDGVSRGFDAYYREVDAEDANLTNYDATQLGGGVDFGFPVSEHNFLTTGLSVERLDLAEGGSTIAREFFAEQGTSFNVVRMDAGFRYDTRNRAILPTEGSHYRVRAEFTAPLFSDPLPYYKLDFRSDWFVPLTSLFTLVLQNEVGYGDGYSDLDALPFFENFYLGGPRSLRGFEENTVGPRDSNNNAIGGNFKLYSSAEMILPLPFLEELRQLRMTAFFDIGNVYNLEDDEETFSLGDLRYSTGLSMVWVSPVGILTLSLASPLGSQDGDRTQPFQFTFGTSF